MVCLFLFCLKELHSLGPKTIHLDKDIRSKKYIGIFGINFSHFLNFEKRSFSQTVLELLTFIEMWLHLSYSLRSWGLLIYLDQSYSLANSTSLGAWRHSARFLGTFSLHAWELSAAFFIIVLKTLYH